MKEYLSKQAIDIITKNGIQTHREEIDKIKLTVRREIKISHWQNLKIKLKISKKPEAQIITIRVWLWEENGVKNFQLIYPPGDFEKLIGDTLNKLEEAGWNILFKEHTIKRGRMDY